MEKVIWREPEVVKEPHYDNTAQYDAVLRAHCRMQEEECAVPAAAIQQPGRRGSVRIL